MRDEDDRLAHLPLNAEELVLQTLSRDPVDRPEGFIHEQDRGVGTEGPSHTHALTLPTRKLMGITMSELLRIEADQFEQVIDATADPLLVPPEKPGHRGHVVRDAHVRKEADVLNDVAHPQAKHDRVDMGDVLLVVKDAALRRLDQPVDHLQGRGLSAARRPNEHGQLTGLELDRQLADGDLAARKALGDPLQPNH